ETQRNNHHLTTTSPVKLSVALLTFPWKLFFFLICTDQQNLDLLKTPLHFPVYQ
ncbi:hypothetical protein AMECASPLE_024701, partial [Ameca splendens]